MSKKYLQFLASTKKKAGKSIPVTMTPLQIQVDQGEEAVKHNLYQIFKERWETYKDMDFIKISDELDGEFDTHIAVKWVRYWDNLYRQNNGLPAKPKPKVEKEKDDQHDINDQK